MDALAAYVQCRSGVACTGTAQADSIFGTDGVETIFPAGGDDNILAWGGNDVVSGGDGEDNILGGSGGDTLNGENDDDNRWAATVEILLRVVQTQTSLIVVLVQMK